jgi:hypothetical protein
VALVATEQGIFRTCDGGSTWQATDLPSAPVLGLCVDVAGTLFIILDEEKEPLMLSSNDTGISWQPLQGLLLPPMRGSTHLEADSFHPGVTYFAANSEVHLIVGQEIRKISEDLPPIHHMLVL